MSDAIEAALGRALEAYESLSGYSKLERLRAAITAYETGKGVGVGVKPLEWEEFERGSGTVYAISIFGRYSAWREGEYGRYETPEGYRSRSIDRGIEAAKAAAQADYEARIRSALTSPASEVEQIIAASTRMAKRLGVAFEIDPAKVEQFIRGTSPASGPTRATAWENIHNGAIRRVEPSDPENYIALGPITSPASGERDAVIEECAKVVDGFVTHRPVFETEDEGGIKWENGGEEIPVLASKIAAALRMEGK